MNTIKPFALLLLGGISIVTLSGCEPLEQATTEAVKQARQTAVQALDEAVKTGSVDPARQSAIQTLQDARQTAAGLLGQASEYLAKEPQHRDTVDPAGEEPALTM